MRRSGALRQRPWARWEVYLVSHLWWEQRGYVELFHLFDGALTGDPNFIEDLTADCESVRGDIRRYISTRHAHTPARTLDLIEQEGFDNPGIPQNGIRIDAAHDLTVVSVVTAAATVPS